MVFYQCSLEICYEKLRFFKEALRIGSSLWIEAIQFDQDAHRFYFFFKISFASAYINKHSKINSSSIP